MSGIKTRHLKQWVSGDVKVVMNTDAEVYHVRGLDDLNNWDYLVGLVKDGYAASMSGNAKVVFGLYSKDISTVVVMG